MSWRDLEPAVKFFVPGVPAPGGSKKAVRAGAKHNGRLVVVDAAKGNRKWRDRVAKVARQHFDGPPLAGPLGLSLLFVVRRPRGHYRTGRHHDKLSSVAPDYPIRKPDTTKLLRAVEDALTGVLWVDDAQIVRQETWKDYRATSPGVLVEVRELAPEQSPAGRT